jgi:RNA polymerase sigma-70 factor, ECF subfamily
MSANTEDFWDARRTSSQPVWADLVDKIKLNDTAGLEDLYRVFSRGVRFYLCRQLGPQDLDDRVHDTFLTVVHAIQRGDLREPDRLMGYVRTIVTSQVAAKIQENMQCRQHQIDLNWGLTVHYPGNNPEQAAIKKENEDIARKMLQSIAPRDRELLIRFYLEEQPAQQICDEMGLTETQFRLSKSRAKARFGELGKRKVTRRSEPFNEHWCRSVGAG